MVGKKLLILDEDETSRRFASNFLYQKQFESLEASLLEEASSVAWHDKWELITFNGE